MAPSFNGALSSDRTFLVWQERSRSLGSAAKAEDSGQLTSTPEHSAHTPDTPITAPGATPSTTAALAGAPAQQAQPATRPDPRSPSVAQAAPRRASAEGARRAHQGPPGAHPRLFCPTRRPYALCPPP